MRLFNSLLAAKLATLCEAKKKFVAAVAVDLDGTLARELDEFDPKKIGPPIHNAKKILDKVRDLNVRIIVNTCRKDLDVVRKWLEEHGIPFDNINDNPDQPKDTSDKIMADRYWDNRQPSWPGLEYAYVELCRYLKRNNQI